MEKTRATIRSILEVVGLAGFILILVLLLRTRVTDNHPGAQQGTTSSPYPMRTEAVASPNESPLPAEPYPPPGGTPFAPSLPAKVQALISARSLLGNATAIALDKGKIWLITSDNQAKTLADFGDVAAIYGWNYNGTKLLFGRGLYKTSGELAKSTELWVYDTNTSKASRLVDSTRVWSASWSPVDDRVAYSEYGNTPAVTVVSLDGNIQQKRDEYLFSDLAWSPDGKAIAISYSGPDMVETDTRFSVLGIWWLEKDELELLSDAKREAHYFPIWLTDGSHILFTRIFGPGSEGGESGLFIADIQTKQMVPLQNGPKYIVNRIMRSPRSDMMVFWMGHEVYVMELGKEPVLLGRGSQPVWHPDGKTILYVGENGLYQIKALDTPVQDQIIGGNFGASTINLQPDIFFK